MPSLLDLRRRIRAVKSTQQITKAMKMVSASKLRRAQERVLGARPFAEETRRVLGSLASRVDSSRHPLLAPATDSRKALLIVVTADKGLCGSFNTNVIKAAAGVLAERPDGEVALALVGRKGRDFFRRFAYEVAYERTSLFAKLSFADAQAIATTAIDAFSSGRVGTVRIVYNEFKTVMQQRVVVEPLLPIARGAVSEPTSGPEVDYLYEPQPETIFRDLLPHYVEIEVYRTLLESAAAEHAARMTAMDAATKNSSEMIDELTLYMNKVRQAAITREIIEVVSGAQVQ